MASRRGHDRERQLVALKRKEGWVAFRAPASLGVADVVALKAGETSQLIESKSTLRPYAHFLPADRQRLSEAAKAAGAEALLAWWPSRGELKWIAESDWPR